MWKRTIYFGRVFDAILSLLTAVIISCARYVSKVEIDLLTLTFPKEVEFLVFDIQIWKVKNRYLFAVKPNVDNKFVGNDFCSDVVINCVEIKDELLYFV